MDCYSHEIYKSTLPYIPRLYLQYFMLNTMQDFNKFKMQNQNSRERYIIACNLN